MSKVVRKLRPSDYWRIGEHESWFTDMAAKGLHLKKMGIHFVQFVKGEPKKVRYRIEVSIKKKIAPEQIQMYAESGWDYVTSYGYFHVFSSLMNIEVRELHTDPAEQSYTLKDLDKRLAMNAVIFTIAIVFLISMLLAIWFLDGTPIFVLVEGMAIQQTILTLFIGYSAYTSLQAARSIRLLRKNLIDGRPINHRAPWKNHYRLHSSIAFLFTIVVGLSSILPFIQLVKMETKTLPEGRSDLPIARLADIEQNPALVRGESSYISDGVDWDNRYSFNWSPLAPVQYETDENGVIPGEMWEELSGEYAPSLHTRVFQLSLPVMADALISDLIKRYSFSYSREDFVEISHPELDQLIVHEDEETKDVFASKGKAVIHARYHGNAKIEAVIESIVEKIDRISE